jgi:hypothetical protein
MNKETVPGHLIGVVAGIEFPVGVLPSETKVNGTTDPTYGDPMV